MNFFYILSGPLGYVMEWIYKLLPSYGCCYGGAYHRPAPAHRMAGNDL